MDIQDKNLKDLSIGSGVLFPFKVTSNEASKTGIYPVTGDTNLIEDNIRSLLLHPMGFKFRQEEYGNKLKLYLEEPNTQALAFLIETHIKGLIPLHERRIFLKQIQSYQQDSWFIQRLFYSLTGVPLEAYMDLAIERNI